MHKSKRLMLGSALAAAALTLTGCGVVGGGGQESDAGAAEGDIAGEITFQTWNLKGGYEEYFTQLIADFEKKYPEVTVNWRDQPAEGYEDNLSADAAAGTLPDVMDLGPDSAYTLASAGKMVNLAEATPDAKAEFLPEAWDAMTYEALGGGTYGYPWYLNTGPSFFNAALFKKCGLDPDKLPTTYDELFKQAEIMGENCDDATMIGRLPAIETFVNYGVQVMNEDHTEFTFNGPEGVELVQHYKDLYEAGALTDSAVNALQTEEAEMFQKGHTAWLPGSSYTLKKLKEQAHDVYENVAMGPAIANAAPNMYIHSIGVSKDSENQSTAIAFAQFITNRENQMSFAKEAGVFPSTANSLDDPYFTEGDGSDAARVRVQAAKQVEEAAVNTPPAFSSSSTTYLHEQVAQAVMGKKPIQDALDDAVKYANDRMVTTTE